MKIYLNKYDPATVEKAESLFFNGNGYLGVRGNLEEAYYDYFATNRETYLNGFYETKVIDYPEKMYGFTSTSETMISVVDGQTTLISIGDESFQIDRGTLESSERYIDLEQGVTVRIVNWLSPNGFETKITITRLASFTHKNLFAMHFEFEKINHELPIYITTHLNYVPVRTIDKNDPRMSHDLHQVEVISLDTDAQICTFVAPNSQITASLKWQINQSHLHYQSTESRLLIENELDGNVYYKVLSYAFHDQEHEGLTLSFEELLADQKAYLKNFWDAAKISIKSRDELEESVNYSTFALLQSLGTDGYTSIAAKGLSGNGYEGHYFWDAEMYIFPLFLHLQPQLAKKMLEYRIKTLPNARENRAMIGYQTGALYPWRTISGTESSAFFEAGSAQHHINADIAYAFINYYRYTNDLEFMVNGGFEVLLETARVFAEIGYLKNNQFHIDMVTGPDEYSVLINDNFYTNRLIEHQYKWVCRLAEKLAENYPSDWQHLAEKLKIQPDELKKLQYYADHMTKIIDPVLGVLAQDRDFLNKAEWPFSNTETKYPLLLHYHPLEIYRYQISKQADAVLALMLFPDDFDPAVTQQTIAYYDKRTTHDSSLSYSAFSVVYSRLGELEKSYQYFLENARTDLDNLHKNTKEGIHTASMGGTFMNIIYGFCNLRLREDGLSLNPHLPEGIEEISFSIMYQNERYQIQVKNDDYQIRKK
ncbi:glycoside hydrolase family 65 protein [Enterococcus sp. DIV0086]|uniref:glycoside hydrolase family 65 protein n=1 Tax=Enterococcus sp. DIV0086 TaxID=2774655 RepID=UPI003D2BB50B